MDEEKFLGYARQIQDTEEKLQQQEDVLFKSQQRIKLLEEQIKAMEMVPVVEEEDIKKDLKYIVEDDANLEEALPKLHRQLVAMQKQVLAADTQLQSLMTVVQRVGVPTKPQPPPLPPSDLGEDEEGSSNEEGEESSKSSSQGKESEGAEVKDGGNGASSKGEEEVGEEEAIAATSEALLKGKTEEISTVNDSGVGTEDASLDNHTTEHSSSTRPSSSLRKQDSYNAIQLQLLEEWGVEKRKEVEDEYREEVAALHKQIEVLERKLQNQRFVAEAHQTVAAEAKAAQWKAEADAKEWRRQLQRMKENDQHRQRTVRLEKLRNDCRETFQQLTITEGEIREVMSDPLLSLPIGTQRRKDLARFERKMKKLKEKNLSQMKLLKELEDIQTLQDDLFAGSSNGNMAQVTRAVEARKTRQTSEDMLEDAKSNPNAAPTCIVTELDVSPNVPDGAGFSALEYASGNGHIEIVHYLVKEAGADVLNGQPLLLAAKNGHTKIVEFLLENDADTTLVDTSGKTALHLACLEGHSSTVEALINAGIDVQPQDNAGNTPLHFLAKTEFLETARILLENGAALDIKSSEAAGGLSPADVAHYENNRQMQLVFRDYMVPFGP